MTQVDFHVQEFIRSRLEQEWPEIQFMGEESDNSDVDINGAFWILDPVDGTTNLIHSFMHSAISLGLCEGGLVCGVIYQPFTGELFSARKGHGAFLNGEPIHVSAAREMRSVSSPSERRSRNANMPTGILRFSRRFFWIVRTSAG